MQNKELGMKLLMDSSEVFDIVILASLAYLTEICCQQIDRHIKTLASELNLAHTGFITS